ncbi:MAG: MFS transporter [Bacillota bacterium]|jgi:MFS family permease
MLIDRLKICNYIEDETTKHNAVMSIMDGVTFSIMTGLTQPFWGAFAVKLGATDYMLALLSSLPALITLAAQIPAAMIIDKYDTRLKPTLIAATSSRVAYLLFALLAVIPGPGLIKAWMFILIFALRNFPGTMCDTAWTSMMGEMFDSRLRGRIFSERSMMTTLFSLLATVVAGPFLDATPWPWNYGILYTGLFCGSHDIGILSHSPERISFASERTFYCSHGLSRFRGNSQRQDVRSVSSSCHDD